MANIALNTTMNADEEEFDKELKQHQQWIRRGNKFNKDRLEYLCRKMEKYIDSKSVIEFDENIQQVRASRCKEMEDAAHWIYGRYSDCLNQDFFRNDDNRGRFRGFSRFSLVYKVTPTWDLRRLTAEVYAPDNLDWSKNVAVQVKLHGGGFTTQSADFEPWFAKHILSHAQQNNAIIVAPNYRKMPEACGKDILEDVSSFWTWYRSERFIVQLRDKLNLARVPGFPVNLRRKKLLVSGESAGGFLAVYSFLKTSDFNLTMQALLLLYPMLGYYDRTRHWEGSIRRAPFMQATYTFDEGAAGCSTMIGARDKLRSIDRCPTRTGTTPPEFMLASSCLSFTGQWKACFQDAHGTRDIMHMIEEKKEDNMFDLKEPSCLPTVVALHAHDDTNCPVEDTEYFIEWYRKKLSHRGDTKAPQVFYNRVDKISTTEGESSAVGHAWDHDSDLNDPVLQPLYKTLATSWP